MTGHLKRVDFQTSVTGDQPDLHLGRAAAMLPIRDPGIRLKAVESAWVAVGAMTLTVR